MNKYALRVYTEAYSFENYNDDIYRTKETEVNHDDILYEAQVNSGDELKRVWEENLEEYEGYTYCIKNLEHDNVMVGGVYDPNDMEYLEDAFELETQRSKKAHTEIER